MVWSDPVSQNIDALIHLSRHYDVPILALHAPCLLITQRVWGREPWGKLHRSVESAQRIAAAQADKQDRPPVIVVHPPFTWQRAYATEFVEGVAHLERTSGVRIAVENMYPWRVSNRNLQAYAPGWNPIGQGYESVTFDISHAAVSGSDPVQMLEQIGPALAHVHLADGTRSRNDEHLVPGRGVMPCAQTLQWLAANGFRGDVVAEINTRRTADVHEREQDLALTLAFAREHLALPSPTPAGS